MRRNVFRRIIQLILGILIASSPLALAHGSTSLSSSVPFSISTILSANSTPSFGTCSPQHPICFRSVYLFLRNNTLLPNAPWRQITGCPLSNYNLTADCGPAQSVHLIPNTSASTPWYLYQLLVSDTLPSGTWTLISLDFDASSPYVTCIGSCYSSYNIAGQHLYNPIYNQFNISTLAPVGAPLSLSMSITY